ncbi:allantoate deiminase [Granulicella rosea]|uniref:Allantoate deiminase n=1 Tax=Granulicella rosea TaxID=474952 RepID=A0A239KVX1_9BACT|nr:allantoate deiminase [Granulicella rosea]
MPHVLLQSLERVERVIARCRELASITDVAGETTRTYLSPATRDAHALVLGWMREAGLSTQVDAVGNLRGLRAGLSPQAPRLLIGSHIDTVVNAGAFDGILGVVLALELIEDLADTPLPYAIELLAFSEEEGVRFRKPFLGSLAVVGELTPEDLALPDAHGTTMEQAIAHFGLDPAEYAAARLAPESFAYLEIHIEQGPVLESEDRPIAAVHAIVGQTRMSLRFTGQANHAGTTPMHLRHDALAAAAEWIVAVEKLGQATPGLVATVGSAEPKPGLGNVIASEVLATLDIRHADDDIRHAAVAKAVAAAQSAADARGVTLSTSTSIDQTAVPMAPHLLALMEAAAKASGYDGTPLTSGAGHDAVILARRVPAIMLFLRSPGGLSHHPGEAVLIDDVEAALTTAMEFLRRLRDDVLSGSAQAGREAHA